MSTVTPLLMGMVMLVAFSSQAQAQTPSDLDTLKITSVSGVAPGDTFDLDLYVTHTDTLGGFTFRISYDETLIEPITDTLGVDTVVVEFTRLIGPADFSQGAFVSIGIGAESGAIVRGIFQVFSFDVNDLVAPGAGPAYRMKWRVLPTATTGTTIVRFQNDPVFPSSFNTIADYSGLIFKRPVLTDGSVTIGEGGPPDTTGGGDTTGTGNNAPSIPALSSPIAVNQGDLVTFNVSATDPEGDSLSLLSFNLPAGAEFTPNNPVAGRAFVSGTFRWTPSFATTGSFSVSFQATDSAGASSSIRNVTIDVVEVQTDLLFTPSVVGQDPRGGIPGAADVIIPVSLTSIQASYGVQFDFVYDPTVFTVTDLQLTDRLSGFTVYDNLGETPGRLRVVAFSLAGDPISAGTSPVLFNIIGDIVSSAAPGAYDVIFENSWESINPDPNVASVPLTTKDGQIFVDFLGDANVDTRVDVADVVAVVGYILGDYTFNTRQFRAGDVVTNDTLDVFDLVSIINIIFGAPLDTESPPTNSPATVNLAYYPDDGPQGSYVLTSDAPINVAGAQFEFTYDPQLTMPGDPSLLPGAARLNLQYRNRGDGRIIALVMYDPRVNSQIAAGLSEIMRIPVAQTGAGTPVLQLRTAKLSNARGETIEVAGFGSIPRNFVLEQNYPNPFNAATTIAVQLDGDGSGALIDARLVIYNVLGQTVRTLHEGGLTAGRHTFNWDGRDDGYNAVASGLYFYRLISGDFAETRKMVLLK